MVLTGKACRCIATRQQIINSNSQSKLLKKLEPETWTWCRDLYINDVVSTSYIYETGILFHPNLAVGTAAVRGQKELNSKTIAYWEINVPYVYGTSLMFGIGKADAKLFSPIRFENLLGENDNKSMGLSHRGFLYHNSQSVQFVPRFRERQPVSVGILFNGPDRTLSYFIDNKFIGEAFQGIDMECTWYPMVSSTAQKSQFFVQHQMSCNIEDSNNSVSLREICMKAILKCTSDATQLYGVLPDSVMSMLLHFDDYQNKCISRSTQFCQNRQTTQKLAGTCVDCGRSPNERINTA